MKEKKKFLIGILVMLMMLTTSLTGCIEEGKEKEKPGEIPEEPEEGEPEEEEEKEDENEEDDSTEPEPPPAPVNYSLTIDIIGQGTTDPSPSSHNYLNGTQVTIEAEPDSSWKFNYWSGDASGNQNPITITMNSDKEVTAHFKKKSTSPPVSRYDLTITINGQGTTNPSPGIHDYTEGTQVDITAVPDTGWEFSHWSGDINETDNPTTIVIDSDKEVMAHFETMSPIEYNLSIEVSGQGTTDPIPGIHSYLEGSQIVVTAIPDVDWEFDHWEGDLGGTDNPTIITIDSDKEVTACFEEISSVEYELTIRVSGQGTTNPSPGIHDYTEGTQVDITAVPGASWQFDYWSSDANGANNPITITMDSDKEVTARFRPPCKVHGLNFGPYTKPGQNPNQGTVISEEQIRELLMNIASYTDWVRTFGCTHGLENTGRIAHELGLEIWAGAWLDEDLTTNDEQISNLITVAQAGEADGLIVGSEVLLRGDLTESQLIGYINRVKGNTSGLPVATADVYGELLTHPAVVDASDVVLPNYYPYWEGISIDYALYYIHLRHQQILAAAGGKPVIVSEAGWPSDGNSIGEAVPSPENASFFFLNFVSWVQTENVPYLYFEAFNEPWKAGYEGPQGAHWGVWDKDGYLKPGMEEVFDCQTMPSNWGTEVIDGPGNATIEFTYVPPYGDYYGTLEGRVSHVSPADCRIAVYILVRGGWWSKPYWNNPLTIIWPDGNWTCDITTGGVDYEATEVTAFLLPFGYDPPLMHGGSTLPQGLYDNALAYVNVTRV